MSRNEELLPGFLKLADEFIDILNLLLEAPVHHPRMRLGCHDYGKPFPYRFQKLKMALEAEKVPIRIIVKDILDGCKGNELRTTHPVRPVIHRITTPSQRNAPLHDFPLNAQKVKTFEEWRSAENK